jgi:hypothetical protein
MGNRINAIPSIGAVLIIFAAVRIGSALLARRSSRPHMVATALTILLTGVLLAGYVRDTRAEAEQWNEAYANEVGTLSFIRTSVPHPPTNSTIFVVRQPQYETPEVPIFISWEFQFAVRYVFGGAPTLAAWAVPWSVPFHCKSGWVYPLQWGWDKTEGAPYGNVWMIDVATRTVWRITNRASCLAVSAAVAALPPARWVLSMPQAA